MLRKLAIVFAAIVALGVASGPGGTASCASAGEFGGGSGRVVGHHSGAIGQSGAASRFVGSGARSGAGYAGTSHRHDGLGHESSGWHQPGFGGTLNPGWGYGFGPQLGGSGH
jgi:hypothetical protein